VETVLATLAGQPCTLQALVRSRPGGYVYSDEEVDTMCRDIRAFKAAGVHGVVVGALTGRRSIDLSVLERFARAADGLQLTFHRALDACSDPLAQLVLLDSTGVERVLTSGGAARAGAGLAVLADMVLQRPGGVEIMAGGGVQLAGIKDLVQIGVDAVHLSARVARADAHPAGPGGSSQDLDVTSADLVARARRELSQVQNAAADGNVRAPWADRPVLG
jgi:copper homeostasis protein